MSAKERIAEYWKMNKKKIYAFCIAFIVVFILKIIGTAFSVLNDEWNKMESPYDIQWEYQTTTMLSHARIALMNIGLSDDNFISNLIKHKQEQYYKAIKMKVPAEDLVIDIVGWTIEYFPYLYTKINNKKLNNQLKEIVDRLIEGHSNIKAINERIKYDDINNLLIYFLVIKPPKIFNIQQNYYIHVLEKLLADKNLEKNSYAFLIFYIRYISFIDDILSIRYEYWDNNTCTDRDYVLLLVALNKAKSSIYQIKNLYEGNKVLKSKIHFILDASKKIEEFDKQVCSKLNANYPSTEIQINH